VLVDAQLDREKIILDDLLTGVAATTIHNILQQHTTITHRSNTQQHTATILCNGTLPKETATTHCNLL